MEAVCPVCKKEFEVSFDKALAYSLNNEENPKCDKCIFDNIISKLDKGFGIEVYDSEGQVKSWGQVLSELGYKWNEGSNLTLENRSYRGNRAKLMWIEEEEDENSITRE